MNAAVCVGIGGGSGSGKTTLVSRLAQTFAAVGVALVEQDRYYRDQSALPAVQRAGRNYDHPDAIEADLIVRDVARLLRGEQAIAPLYDFVTHTRCGEQVIEPGRLIIVEGILVLHWPDLRGLMDVAVFIDADEQVRLERRMERDVEQRGRTPESVREQFAVTVQPMHREFVDPCRSRADRVIAGDESGERDVVRLEEHIRGLLLRQACEAP